MAMGFLSLSAELRNEVYSHIFRRPEEEHDFDCDLPLHLPAAIKFDSSLSFQETSAQAKELHLRSRHNYHDRGLCTHKAFLRCCRQIYHETWPLFVQHHRFVLTHVDDLAACLTSKLLPRTRMDMIQHVALVDLDGFAQKTVSNVLSDMATYGKTLEQVWINHLEWFNNLRSLTIDLRFPNPPASICPETYLPPVVQPIINCIATMLLAYDAHPSGTKPRFHLLVRPSNDTLLCNDDVQVNYIRLTTALTRTRPLAHAASPRDDFDLARYPTHSAPIDGEYGWMPNAPYISRDIARWSSAVHNKTIWRTWTQMMVNSDVLIYATDQTQNPPVPNGNVIDVGVEESDPEDEWNEWERRFDRRVAGRTVWFRHLVSWIPGPRVYHEDEQEEGNSAWQSLELPDGIHCRIPDRGFKVADEANPRQTTWQAPCLEFSAGELSSATVHTEDDAW